VTVWKRWSNNAGAYMMGLGGHMYVKWSFRCGKGEI
jgi:hypothetical protein